MNRSSSREIIARAPYWRGDAKRLWAQAPRAFFVGLEVDRPEVVRWLSVEGAEPRQRCCGRGEFPTSRREPFARNGRNAQISNTLALRRGNAF